MVKDLSLLINKLGAGEVLWAKPALWCQKAYDFLCFWKDESTNALNMVVLNATLAQTHSVLLEEVRKLAAGLGKQECVVTAIRFDFLVPKDAHFTFGDISGRLCEWKNLQGVQWPNAPSWNSYFSQHCLAVAEVVQTSN